MSPKTIPSTTQTFPNLTITQPSPNPQNVHIITMRKPPENRLTPSFAQSLIAALRHIETHLIPASSPGAVVIQGSDEKFWCTGLDLDESSRNPYANADGFYPLLATLLDYPYPTVALLTGHTFGGACPFALSCDYRVMNARRGFFSMPPVNLGLHFDGITALPRLKLHPRVARRMLLEAHRWTGKDALADGIVDEVAEPADMWGRAIEVAAEHAPRARMGVYGLLRGELWGDALEKLKRISYVHSRRVGTEAKAKI